MNIKALRLLTLALAAGTPSVQAFDLPFCPFGGPPGWYDRLFGYRSYAPPPWAYGPPPATWYPAPALAPPAPAPRQPEAGEAKPAAPGQ